MSRILRWASLSHEQSVRNARTACTACSRRRVEREEVALYLARREELARERASGGESTSLSG